MCLCVVERERERFFSFRACVLQFSRVQRFFIFSFSQNTYLIKNERTKRRATAELFTARMRFVSWQRDDDDDDDDEDNNNNNNNHE